MLVFMFVLNYFVPLAVVVVVFSWVRDRMTGRCVRPVPGLLVISIAWPEMIN